MYWRAARRETDPLARHDARVLVGHSFVYVGVAALSMLLAMFGGLYASAYSGVAYGMTGPCQALYHALTRRYWKPPVEAGPTAALPAAAVPGAATDVSPEGPETSRG